MDDALHERRSRRAALRLLAGGALGGALALGGARPDAVEAAVTALPALPKGWTNLAGTTTGLLFYRRGAPGATAGTGACGTFVDGRFARKATLATFAPDWTTIVGAGPSLFFYRAGDGVATTAYLDGAGIWHFSGVEYQHNTNWRVYPGTKSGRFVIRHAQNDSSTHLHLFALTADGRKADIDETNGSLAPGNTHGAGVGVNAYLFYYGADGTAATGRIERRINSIGRPELYWVPGAAHAFATGWTHVVGTFNGGLLFYNRQTGAGATGYLDASGNFSQQLPNPRFGVGWTHVVGAGGRSVLFYNKASGKGVGGFLSAAGVWTKTTTYG